MGAINAEKFKQICDSVWRDRAAILSEPGSLSDEAALVRAIYWRLCKAGGEPGMSMEDCDAGQMFSAYQRLVSSALACHAHPHFDGVPFIAELVRRFRDEAAKPLTAMETDALTARALLQG